MLTKVYGLGVKLAHVNEGQCNCTWGDMLDRLDAFSGMHISQLFSYRFQKLQMCTTRPVSRYLASQDDLSGQNIDIIHKH